MGGAGQHGTDTCRGRWRQERYDDTLVPTARLELAQLSPLPPQDSVSTNFTTSAVSAMTCPDSHEDWLAGQLGILTESRSLCSSGMRCAEPASRAAVDLLCGIARRRRRSVPAAHGRRPERRGAALGTARAAPGICAAPVRAGSRRIAAGAPIAGRSSTLPSTGRARSLAKYASAERADEEDAPRRPPSSATGSSRCRWRRTGCPRRRRRTPRPCRRPCRAGSAPGRSSPARSGSAAPTTRFKHPDSFVRTP